MPIIPADPYESLNKTNRIVYILNGMVVHAVDSGERFAAIAQSNPTVVDVTNLPNVRSIDVGYVYDAKTGQFYAPGSTTSN
jgi:hypothetical protein